MYVCMLNVHTGTHDLQNISVSSPFPGQVRVTGDFIEGSTAIGYMTVTLSSSELHYHMVPRVGKQHVIESVLSGFAGGQYSISLFVIGENGLPFERVATTPRVTSVNDSTSKHLT